MKEFKKIIDNNSFFVDFSLFWIIFGWLALVSTLLDFFYTQIFVAYFIAGFAYFFRKFLNNKNVWKISPNFIAVNIFLLVFVTFLSFFVTPTVFTGRDQGSISNAAILLSQNHQLRFSTPASDEFFSIYGPGKALNFPGFHYTKQGELTTQFPLGYISWLGAFYSIFGLSGLIIANSVALFLFFLSLYVVGRKLLKKRFALLLTLLALTSFSFAWFFKYTLSENLAMALLWITVASVIYLTKNPGKKTLLLFVLSATLLLFTRIEGYAYLITGSSILLFNRESRDFIKQNRKWIFIAVFAFLLAFALNFQKDLPFFKEIGKASIGSFIETGDDGKIAVKDISSPAIRITQIHILYGLAGFLFLGALGMAAALGEKRRELLIPLFIVFPTFVYFIDSNISSDHPWMLRRFAFALLPLFIFYAANLIKYLSEKNPQNSRHPMLWRHSAIILSLSLIFLNLIPFLRFSFISENQGLLEQTQKLASNFSDKDLVLLDRLSSGDGWSLLSGPMDILFRKQAVYFFNTEDIKKIDLEKFENVYIITSEKQLPTYAASEIGNQLSVFKKYLLRTDRLIEKPANEFLPIIGYPQKKTVETQGYILKLEK